MMLKVPQQMHPVHHMMMQVEMLSNLLGKSGAMQNMVLPKKSPLTLPILENMLHLSRENIESAPITNLNCRSKNEMMMIIQKWQAWARTQKLIFKDKVSWSDLALRLTWGFTGNLGLWWERVREEDKLKLLNNNAPIEELVKAVVHEFYGNMKIDSNHFADLFMNQQLCHISQLPEFLCTMQDLLYKVPDPENVAYLRKYLSAMPGKVPNLVRDRLEELDIDISQLSLAGLHEHIVMALQKECLRKKTNKSIKKQLGFDSSVCDTFAETYHFGCNQKIQERIL
jgi:hypothetical protein